MRPDGTRHNAYTNVFDHCYNITWDASTGIKPHLECAFCTNRGEAVTIGHFVVDKVGEEQDSATLMGSAKMTPYKARFEANSLGKALLDAKIAQVPKDITDGQATMHKDADGNWVAQL